MAWNTNLVNKIVARASARPFITFDCKEISAHDVDFLIKPYGRRTIWPHPVDINHNPVIAPEAQEEGAEHCLEYEDELARLEIIVKEFWDYLLRRFNRMQPDAVILAFRARCTKGLDEYMKLLLKISIERASAETEKPLRLMDSNTLYFKMADQDVEVKPWDTSLIVDDTGESIMTVKHNKVLFGPEAVKPADTDPAVRLEMVCEMYMRSITSYQALIADGAVADLRFSKAPDADSIFIDHKSRLDFARYRFPEDRNGFVCHLVNLLKNSDDYEKYFKFERAKF